MTTPDNTSPRSGFGWLPKLILWGLVITFAYLYLSSIEREGNPSFTEVVDSINKLNPLAITALPSAEPAVTPNVASQTAAARTANETAPAAAPVNTPVTTAPAQAALTTAPARIQPPAPAAETPIQTASARQINAPVVTPQAPTAMTSAPAPAPMQAAPAAPAAVQPMAPAPFDPNLIAWQQDRIRAQYEAQYDAMRREADERMRQHWERMQPPVPAASPYGYPGFLPGYAPGYAPGVYPSPR